MFSDLISLSLFFRLGIQLCFTTSMLMSLFTANQICYHQCEAKTKRSQIGVRRRISELLCVKSTFFFFFFFSDPISNFWLKLGIYPGTVETSPVRSIFKPVWNILAIPADTVRNHLPWNKAFNALLLKFATLILTSSQSVDTSFGLVQPIFTACHTF